MHKVNNVEDMTNIPKNKIPFIIVEGEVTFTWKKNRYGKWSTAIRLSNDEFTRVNKIYNKLREQLLKDDPSIIKFYDVIKKYGKHKVDYLWYINEFNKYKIKDLALFNENLDRIEVERNVDLIPYLTSGNIIKIVIPLIDFYKNNNIVSLKKPPVGIALMKSNTISISINDF